MKLRTVLLASLITLVPAVALAHPHGDRAEKRQRMIERFDADGDGKLTGAEKQRARQARKMMKKQRMQKRFDADGDGQLGPAEKQQARQARKKMKQQRQMKMARRFDRILERLDQNGDGVVGPEEAGDRFQKLQRFDANGDGWLTRDELPGAKR